MTETFFKKLEQLAERIAADQLDRLVKEKLDCAGNRARATAKIVSGRKYTKVNVGDSGRYMVDNDTGEIFGIKGYGQIHRGHRFGTLDTISHFYWGYHTARPINSAEPSRAV